MTEVRNSDASFSLAQAYISLQISGEMIALLKI